MSEGVKIACRGADSLPLDAIEEFQGDLKKRGKAEIEQIITSINKYGFSFPFFIWSGDGHNRCLDGHGRIQALGELRRRGVDLPLFPVAYVEAKDEAEAKQKLLRLNSQYGTMTVESVIDFMGGLEIEVADLALPSGTLELIGEEAVFDYPALAEGDRELFQQMTFTLADEQAELVKEAIRKAIEAGGGESDINANSNGNALAAIAGYFLGA